MAEESAVKKPTDSGYYAWSHRIKESAQTMDKLGVSDFSPRPIEGDRDASPQTPAAGSAWNTGGTWEERDVSTAAVASLKDALLRWELPMGEKVVRITKVDKLEGSVRVLFIRGRPRLGFEFDEPKLRWAVLDGPGGDKLGKGSIAFEEIADDCGGEYEFAVHCSGSAPAEEAQQARSAIRAAAESLAACINQWRDETLAAAVGPAS